MNPPEVIYLVCVGLFLSVAFLITLGIVVWKSYDKKN